MHRAPTRRKLNPEIHRLPVSADRVVRLFTDDASARLDLLDVTSGATVFSVPAGAPTPDNVRLALRALVGVVRRMATPATPAPQPAQPAPGIAPLPSYQRPVTWGGRAMQALPQGRIARTPNDPRTPARLPPLDGLDAGNLFAAGFDRPVPEREMAAEALRRFPQGLMVAPRVVVTPTAAALLRRARVHSGSMIASDTLRWMQEKLLKALFAAAQAETPTPGTHATLRVQYGGYIYSFPYPLDGVLPVPVPFYGLDGELKKPGWPVALFAARVVRFADGELGVVVDVQRRAEAAAPRWFPGEAPQVLAARPIPATVLKHVADAKPTEGRVPLRVDAHPDGRVRIVWEVVAMPDGWTTPGEKRPAPGTLLASIYYPTGKFAPGGYDTDPAWEPRMDLRLAPDEGEAMKPTLVLTSDEAVEKSGYKKKGMVVHYRQLHFNLVAQALRTGRPVAPEVLGEYPSLVAYYGANARTGESRAEVLARREAELRATDEAEDPDITVHWSVQNGLLLYTRGKDPKLIAAIRALRGNGMHFKWGSSIGAWFRPQSVGVSESTLPIDRVAKALREQGIVVRVERGEAAGSLGEANERRQEHKFWRSSRYEQGAAIAEERGAAHEARAAQIVADVPVGAPTRQAERAEARSEREEGRAQEDYEAAARRAGAAASLAQTAASYDTTATITRKEAERRVDALGDLIQRKAKGITGAAKLDSRKKDNLSEYSVAWHLYNPREETAVRIDFDGRMLKVQVGKKGEPSQTPIHADVTAVPIPEVWESLAAALPKKSADADKEVITDPKKFQVALSEYGKRRTGALAEVVPHGARESVFLRPAGPSRYHRGEWDDLSISTSLSDFSTLTGANLQHHEGMTFRLTVHQGPPEKFAHHSGSEKLIKRVADVLLDFSGMTVPQAWVYLVAVLKAAYEGAPIPIPGGEAPQKPARKTAAVLGDPSTWIKELAAYGERRVGDALDGPFTLSKEMRWRVSAGYPERYRMGQLRPDEKLPVRLRLAVMRKWFSGGGFGMVLTDLNEMSIPMLELNVGPDGPELIRVDRVRTEQLGRPESFSVESMVVPLDFRGRTAAQAWEMILGAARALLAVKPLDATERTLQALRDLKRAHPGVTLTERNPLPDGRMVAGFSAPGMAPIAITFDATRAEVDGLDIAENTHAAMLEAVAQYLDATASATLQDREARAAAARDRASQVAARVRETAARARAARDRLRAPGTEDDEAAEALAAAREQGHHGAFYPTPPTLASHVVDLLGTVKGRRVLEPSAGLGALVEPLLARGAAVTAVEFDPARARYLEARYKPAGAIVRAGDFLGYGPAEAAEDGGLFDAVAMNPPFGVEGRRFADIDHVLHALALLRPGGELVAVMSPATPTRSGRKSEAFRAAIAAHNPRWETVDSGRFRISGTDIPAVILRLTR